MIEQSYMNGLLGGLLIGVAGAIYLLGNGRIMGASGIIGAFVDGSAGDSWRERLLFMVGLILAPWAIVAATGNIPETHLTTNTAVILAAGLLVGIGARIANGCTSGHGVCGISRLSVRGIAATIVYVLAGGVSVLVFKHILGVI